MEWQFQEFDKDHDGKVDRDEFADFLQGFTKKETTRISTNVFLLLPSPLLVDGTRQVTEKITKVGGVERVVPPAIISSVVTTAIVLLGIHFRGSTH